MISRGLLLVLLVLTCLQSFTTAQNSKGPDKCCFNYQHNPIPIEVITGYKKTDHQCTNPGVIFTLKKEKRQVCVKPDLDWVKNNMKRIDQIPKEAESSV